MTDLVAGDPRRTTKDRTRPGPASVALRPLGYLLVGLVWLTIWLFAVGILVGSVFYLAYDDPAGLHDVADRSPLVQGIILVVTGVFLGLVIGPGGWHVVTASWPLALLSFTCAIRSLRPSYAREKLSFTAYAISGSTFGPPTLGDVAMSLQPVRPSRFTDAMMRFYVAGWTLSLRMLLAMVPAGFAWSTAIVAITPAASDRARLVAGVLTAVLLVMSLVLGVRAFRIGDFDADAPVEDVSISAESPRELARRRKTIERARAKRRKAKQQRRKG